MSTFFTNAPIRTSAPPPLVTRIFRSIVEAFWRIPDEQLGYLYGGWLTMGMLLSLPMILVGLWAIATAKPVAYAPKPAEDAGTRAEDTARP